MNIRMTLALTAGMGFSQSAFANTIHVCPTCAHTTIQAAVSDAVSGDSILIASGRYTENITIEDKQLTLQGALGGTSRVTEVDAAGRGPVSVLGSGVAGAIPELIEIHNLVIAQGNHTGGTGVGGGVQVRAGAYLHIFDSTISRNISSVGGGIGVSTPNAPQTTITNCLVSENLALPDPTVPNAVADITRGGGVAVTAGSVSIQESTISRNQATGNGGGIAADESTALSAAGSTISENSTFSITDSSGVSAGIGGGVILVGDFTISGSSITNNLASGETAGAGGLFAFMSDRGVHAITNTIISRNSVTGPSSPFCGSGVSAGGICAESTLNASVFTLNNVYIVENLAGGGLVTTDGVVLKLSNTTIRDNVGGNCLGPACPP
jgi:predicted outer membrane repeat protein